MTMRIVLTVLEIVLLVAVLGYFLNRVARQLNSICKTLGKIAFGVRAVETQCAAIGPAADSINTNLTRALRDLEQVAARAERIAP